MVLDFYDVNIKVEKTFVNPSKIEAYRHTVRVIPQFQFIRAIHSKAESPISKSKQKIGNSKTKN